MSTIEQGKECFEKESLIHYTGTKKPPGLQCGVTGGIETYSLFMCFASKEGLLCIQVLRKMTLTPRPLATVQQKASRASKIKEASFSADKCKQINKN